MLCLHLQPAYSVCSDMHCVLFSQRERRVSSKYVSVYQCTCGCQWWCFCLLVVSSSPDIPVTFSFTYSGCYLNRNNTEYVVLPIMWSDNYGFILKSTPAFYCYDKMWIFRNSSIQFLEFCYGFCLISLSKILQECHLQKVLNIPFSYHYITFLTSQYWINLKRYNLFILMFTLE